MPRQRIKPIEPIAYSPNALAAALGITLERVSAAIRRGELHAHRIGCKSRILRIDGENWLRAQPPFMKEHSHG